MIIERMEWDSNFFDMEVGRLQLDSSEDLKSVEALLLASAFDVVYLLMDQSSDDRVGLVEAVAPLYDRKVVFRKEVVPANSHGGHAVALYNGTLNADLLELALMSGEYSRYNLDPRFKHHFRELYTTWIEKSLSGEIADAVFVTRSDVGLSGLITLSREGTTGKIGLIAVHPDARGQGIATALMGCADEWFVRQGCSKAIVVTQRINHAACCLYEKSGYKLESETLVFHFWKDEQET